MPAFLSATALSPANALCIGSTSHGTRRLLPHRDSKGLLSFFMQALGQLPRSLRQCCGSQYCHMITRMPDGERIWTGLAGSAMGDCHADTSQIIRRNNEIQGTHIRKMDLFDQLHFMGQTDA